MFAANHGAKLGEVDAAKKLRQAVKVAPYLSRSCRFYDGSCSSRTRALNLGALISGSPAHIQSVLEQ